MDLSQLRIGYVPYSDKLDQAGDRRRFCYYVRHKKIKFEIAKPSEAYDLVVVTERGDLSVWSDYHKGNAKVIYDVIDAYLSIPKTDPKGFFRGLAKYVTGQSRYLRLDHWKAIQTMCQRSDAVICNTDELKRVVLPFCKNVHLILDIHDMFIRDVKTDYSAGEIFNFVWEGFPQNVQFFFEIQDVLEYLKTKHKIALHVVTLLRYGQYMDKYRKRNTADITRKLFDRTYLYEWNELLCSKIITACDMALIPIPLNDPFALGKSENKLILFWRMGMPTVVSATPAYSRAMSQAGLSMACWTSQEWKETLERYMSDISARRDAGQRGKAFAEDHYHAENILAQWDHLFESVLDDRKVVSH